MRALTQIELTCLTRPINKNVTKPFVSISCSHVLAHTLIHLYHNVLKVKPIFETAMTQNYDESSKSMNRSLNSFFPSFSFLFFTTLVLEGREVPKSSVHTSDDVNVATSGFSVPDYAIDMEIFNNQVDQLNYARKI